MNRSSRSLTISRVEPLERRALLSVAAAAETPPLFTLTTLPQSFAGFTFELRQPQSFWDPQRVYVTGGAGEDFVRVTVNPTNPLAIDLDLNGQACTVDLGTGRTVNDRTIPTAWTADAGAGNDLLIASIDHGDFARQTFTLAGGDGDDRITLSGSGSASGGAGNDELTAGTSNRLSGDDGDDVLRGSPSNDVIEGGKGIDRLYGGDGNDVLSVGPYGSLRDYVARGVDEPVYRVEPGEVYQGGPGDDKFFDVHDERPLPDSDVPPPPLDIVPEYVSPFTTQVGGFTIEFEVLGIDNAGRPWAGRATITGTDGDDTFVATRDGPLLNFVLNGQAYILDFTKLPVWIDWRVNTGGGNDRVEVTSNGQKWDEMLRYNFFDGTTIRGGAGDDTIITKAVLADFHFRGNPAPVGHASFVVHGDEGNDVVQSDTGGRDTFYGGAGEDVASGATDSDAPPAADPPATDPPLTDPPAQPPPPQAAFRGRPRLARGRFYRFRVVYTAPERIDPAALPLPTVTGPGFAGVADLVRAKASRRGTRVVATYRLDALDGRFDAADNGTYRIWRSPGSVETAAGELGALDVQAKAFRRRSGALG
jgi:Ca2+-binding RTX toxin-like protein